MGVGGRKEGMSFQWSFFSKETFKKEFINTMIKKHPWTLQDPESRIVTAICLQIIYRKLNYLSKYLVVFLFVFFVFVIICLNFYKTKKLLILQVNKYHLSYCKHYWNSHHHLLEDFGSNINYLVVDEVTNVEGIAVKL